MVSRLNGQLLTRRVGVALAANLAVSPAALAAAACPSGGVVPSAARYAMPGFLEKQAKAAKDLSGLACRAGAGGISTCLVANDDSSFVQAARLDGLRLVPYGPARPGGIGPGVIPLITGDGPAVRAAGIEPGRLPDGTASALGCTRGHDGFKNFDGEAVAFDGEYFYVAGSHGCSRNGAKLQPSSFLLARMRLNDAGQDSGLQMTYRLSDALQASPELAGHYAKPLRGEPPGLNIEGMAAVGAKLVFGLRAPLLRPDGSGAGPAEDGDAILLSLGAAELFNAEQGASAAMPGLARVALGRNAGVRDLVPLPDGRLLLLSGAARSDNDEAAPRPPFRIWIVEAGRDGTMAVRPPVRELACLAPATGSELPGNPEAILVLGPGPQPDTIRLLVVFDGPKDGNPLEYVVPLPSRGTPR